MARRKFYRNTITLLVYTEDDKLSDQKSLDIPAIIAEAEDGRYIADLKSVKSQRVKTMKQLRKELIKIGNDGTFFDVL